MKKKRSMFYSYIVSEGHPDDRRRSGDARWLEFHNGWDKDEVKQGKDCFSRAICLKDITKIADDGTPLKFEGDYGMTHHQRLADFIDTCEFEIDAYEMQRVKKGWK